MNKNTEQKKLELFNDNYNPDRENRLCVSISDIHLTDGSVGFQNLRYEDWIAFSDDLSARCKDKNIKEVTFVLDGDVVDMIRSSKWAEKGIYPWQRENIEAFDHTQDSGGFNHVPNFELLENQNHDTGRKVTQRILESKANGQAGSTDDSNQRRCLYAELV